MENIAHVTPIPLKYRPLSITSIISKILEKLIARRLYKFTYAEKYYTKLSLVTNLKQRVTVDGKFTQFRPVVSGLIRLSSVHGDRKDMQHSGNK